MLFKKLNDSNEIPMIGLGTWKQTDKSACISAVKTALELGYRHIDTAKTYLNHAYIGEAIRGYPRSKLYITSKLPFDKMQVNLVESECDRYLMDLDTDYLDLFLIHWPDRTKPMADILFQMSRLQEKGKVKSIGVSNFTVNHLKDMLNQKLKFQVNQVEYHPFLNQVELKEFCDHNNIAIEAYCPLARGKVIDDPSLLSLQIKYKKNPAQISLRWLIQKDLIVLPKGSSKEHLKENFNILNFEISKEDMHLIDNISNLRGKRLIIPEFADFEY